MPAKLRFKKTLVIGLGTSGKDICDSIAERLQWQYGSARNTPWVRFFVLETDRDVPRKALDGRDIQPLTIEPGDFASLINHTSPHDQEMDLSTWVDWDTLRRIPDGQVTAGAGNIRMVGRLALLYTENFNQVREGIRARVEELRHLDVYTAQEAFKTAYGPNAPEIELDSGLRVFVVGSLCGGTCSGTVTDFGYIVKDVLGTSTDKTGAFLTLPSENLDPSTSSSANRFKRNAFAALQELNHFHYRRGDRAADRPTIRAGGRVLNTGDDPYDAVYLLSPTGTEPADVDKLHRAIAERIYINIFNNSVDQYARLVDAQHFTDPTGHAFAFCTFGLATIEYPVQEVLKACTYRLLWKAFVDWTSLPAHVAIDPIVASLGISFDVLSRAFMEMEDDSNGAIEAEVTRTAQRAAQGFPASKDAAQKAITGLRQKFETTYPQRVEHAARRLAMQKYQEVLQQVQGMIAGPNGLAKSRAFVREVLGKLDALQAPAAPNVQAAMNLVNTALQAVVQQNPGCAYILPHWRRAKRAVEKAAADLSQRVLNEMHSRETVLAIPALRTGGTFYQFLRPRVQELQARLDRLNERVTGLMNKLDRDARNLAMNMPNVHGQVLFDPGWSGGTVLRRYQAVLENLGNSGGQFLTGDEVEQREAREIIRCWETELSNLITGQGADWLRQPVIPGAEVYIPQEVFARMEERARGVFREIQNTSVVDELLGRPDRDAIARNAVDQMRPFIVVQEAQVLYGGGRPLQTTKAVLVPNEDQTVLELLRNNGLSAQSKPLPSGERSRIVLLQEYHRFPLRAAPAIVDQTSGVSKALSNARCNDFPTFFTRKDVDWVSISLRDRQALQDAENTLALGILLDVVQVEQRALKFPVQPMAPGQPNTCELPGTIGRAARRLALSEGQRTLPIGALNQLTSKVQAAMEELAEQKTHEEAVRVLSDRVLQYSKSKGVSDLPVIGPRAITFFCLPEHGGDKAWKTAYNTVFAPIKEQVATMRKKAGDPWPDGEGKGKYEEDGIYCTWPGCYSIVGRDEDEAARNGWRCYHQGHNVLESPSQ